MAYLSAPLAVMALNCRGLNIPERRTHLLRELRKKRISIAMLQETHFLEGSAPKLRNRQYPNNFFSNHPTTRKAGVAIVLAAELDFKELDKVTDKLGRFLFLKGTIADRMYTLASIYVPNKNQARFLRRTMSKLSGFSEGTLVVGGDLNAPLNPQMDTSTGHCCMPISSIHSIRKSMGNLGLVDCWRVLNPDVKDYTHYSALHNRYSRIDYILIQQEGLSRLKKAAIDPAT
ncbi:Hypothetical predicted protein [Pelobates cultripes]|uniref:exodeoxyribonuclease III n=1 Tax=Pelobates cultripes TaxID=61616 RepID=A0AAD1SS42_PELCU|nr:Hypothetical predicted protein [Pelobates cultripes]